MHDFFPHYVLSSGLVKHYLQAAQALPTRVTVACRWFSLDRLSVFQLDRVNGVETNVAAHGELECPQSVKRVVGNHVFGRDSSD